MIDGEFDVVLAAAPVGQRSVMRPGTVVVVAVSMVVPGVRMALLLNTPRFCNNLLHTGRPIDRIRLMRGSS